MNEEKAASRETVQQVIALKKEIIPYEQSTPAEEPLFVNHCQVGYHTGTVYIDVGVIPLDELVVPTPPTELRFMVLSRLVMSSETLMSLKGQIDELAVRIGGPDAKGEHRFGSFSWNPASIQADKPESS